MISIIVPAYNIESYLPACLDDLLAQTLSEMEFIVVDDGSTDKTGSVANDYAAKDNRVQVIHKKNGGVTSARLCGIQAASGEWIGFVDGDDRIEPWMFERLYSNAVAYEADLSHCGYQMEFPDHADFYYNTGRLFVQKNGEALKELISGKQFEPGLCNKLFRRKLFDGILREELVDPQVHINEDLLMNFYLFREAGTVVFEDVCPYHYIVRHGSAANSGVSVHKLMDPEIVRQILLNETKEDPELHSLCLQSMARHLIRIATMNLREYQGAGEVYSCIMHARRELKNRISEIKCDPYLGKKLKAQAVWASGLPDLYRRVHQMYGELTGVGHKYDIRK